MKYLLLLAVIGIAIWIFKARRRVPGPRTPPSAKGDQGREQAPTAMLVCAHCGVHLPQTEALLDPAGRAFCSPAHLQAGAR